MRSVKLQRAQRGISLVEMMVALFIGLLTVLAITGMMSSYSTQQRSGRAQSDAQFNALIGLHTVEQDIRRAGFGISANELQDCTDANLRSFYGNSTATSAATIANLSLAASTIVDGGSGADRVILRYAESVRGQVPSTLAAAASNTAASVSVNSAAGIAANDLILLASGSNCSLRQVTAVSGTTLTLASSGTGTYNPPNTVATTAPTWHSFASGAKVYTLGSFVQRDYSLSGGNLVVRNLNESTSVPIAANVVDLQVQYGIAVDATSPTVTQWVDATGGFASASMSVADRKRIRAIRIAVVARSTERDNADVAPASIQLWPAASTGITTATAATYTVPDRRLRYRVLRTVIPLKNQLWANYS
jgi:type IV pilus assembly protein PilW